MCEGCCHYLLFLYGFVLFLLWLYHVNIPNRRCSIVRLGCLCGYMYFDVCEGHRTMSNAIPHSYLF